MKKVLVPIAPGCEEMEAVIIIDILRRGGVNVITASPEGKPIKASRGVVLASDVNLEDALSATDFNLVAIPGGMGGTQALLECDALLDFLRLMSERGRLIGAICAAPLILGKAGLLDGRRFTAYPGVIDPSNFPGAVYTGEALVEDTGVITSRGPGTAFDFALALLGKLEGSVTQLSVDKQLVRTLGY